MISGAHVIVYSTDADADRAFFRDVLNLDNVDSGGGWLIFALPPAEVALHPAEANGRHELYLLCTDLEATLAELKRNGIATRGPVREQDWGRLATIVLPGGGDLGIYQPKHALAPHQPTS
jgi:predicted enzyme related to lactoylglutathione lyase